ncbi:hypothetical protein [Ralstonia pseudosolanacearum]|uniref:hypothetical protein n=1 Tax=Ralstonia pseudosolanacearum TaxID=1310165 RepID=UPI0009BCC22D|nr:hypothetical protein [Ralstonia pseudosolanacearum]MCL1618479.1 hypothetical protein [Ralstonia pseudosolanacearum CaRs-Mep]
MEENENTRRAWTYNAAVDAGLDPRAYAWEGIPEGTWPARLDFKTWSNTTAAGHLVCYFTALSDGQHYRLSAFRPGGDSRYRYTPKDGGIDFSQRDLDGQTFLLTVGRNTKGGATWLAAEFNGT